MSEKSKESLATDLAYNVMGRSAREADRIYRTLMSHCDISELRDAAFSGSLHPIKDREIRERAEIGDW